MHRGAVGLMCVVAGLVTACASGGQGSQAYQDAARWVLFVPPGWHTVRFSDSKDGVGSAGIQLSNVPLPAPTLHPGYAIQVNGEVLPPRGVGLIIATDTDRGLQHGKVAMTPLPLPWPDGHSNGDWALGSAPPRSPVFETLWFRVHGRTYIAAITIGWKASRAAQTALGQIVRSIRPTAANSPRTSRTAPLPAPSQPLAHDTASPYAAMPADCTASGLAGALEGSPEPGTAGMALAGVYVWNTTARPCSLVGPVTVTGLDQAGRQVTLTVHFAMPVIRFPLSPDARGPGKKGRIPGREVVASMLLIAAGTHPNDPGLACPGHQINPATWRIALGSRGSITTPNSSAASGPALTRDGGLTTCRGKVYGQSPMLIGPP